VYATPAVARNVQRNAQATVYWIGLGARYAITPMTGLDVAYSFNSQQGSINALQANQAISRSVLTVAFTARWRAPDKLGTGRR
jgi:long-subunit fatty acid transport protein